MGQTLRDEEETLREGFAGLRAQWWGRTTCKFKEIPTHPPKKTLEHTPGTGKIQR